MQTSRHRIQNDPAGVEGFRGWVQGQIYKWAQGPSALGPSAQGGPPKENSFWKTQENDKLNKEEKKKAHQAPILPP